MKKIKLFLSLIAFISILKPISGYSFERNDAKDACRQKMMSLGWPSGADSAENSEEKAPIQGNEKVENMVDLGRSAIRNLQVMEERNLLSAKLKVIPWSDYYWPIADGQIALRYMDPEMPGGWKEGFDYFFKMTTSQYLEQGKSAIISPAEKYSYVNGDLENVLAQSLWNEGKLYLDQYGQVERWMGLCHGWAAASLMLPAPSKKVTYQEMEFFPSDIKALGTLLWANGNFMSKYLGGRCNVRNPARDEFGRVIDQNCFDINPGAWHMAVVNQIGISKRGFVMDATFDYQVWNQPVFAYNFKYFQPETSKESMTLSDSILEYQAFKKDPYVKYRKGPIHFIVGVAMEVEYVLENNPDHREGPFTPITHKATYRYDLELDDKKQIIGGEWHSKEHPDFLWLPIPGAKIRTTSDVLENARQSLPVSHFVELLFQESKEK